MKHIKQNISVRLVTVFLIAVLVMSPLETTANTHYGEAYAAMDTNEKIAYLYGMIAQLQVILEIMLKHEDGGSDAPSSSRSNIEVDTLSATDIERDGARLRGRVDLNREDEALVWFEYGERSSRLDERTSKRRVTDVRSDITTFSIVIDDLDRNERYYYRAVAEDEDGERVYGTTRSFTTGDTRDDDDDDDSSSRGDFELSVSRTSLSPGDSVRVDWEVPSGDAGSRNWIGLYRVGEPDSKYVKWAYVDNATRGTKSFTIDSTGDYEFRLFLNNTYNQEVKSRTIRVN